MKLLSRNHGGWTINSRSVIFCKIISNGLWVCKNLYNIGIYYNYLFSEDFEMLKALYDFEATSAKTLSFSEGDFFYLQQTNTKQRNWWHVVNRKGQVGFVPSNYVQSVMVGAVIIN